MRVCVVHNNVDQATSIGKLASWAVTTALAAGFDVTVVAHDLDAALQSDVSWRPLLVPPRVHALQWAVARQTILHALRGARFDVLHVFQPQIAGLADTWHVEFLSRVAIETGSLPLGSDTRTRIMRAQQLAVARMEDHYLRRIGERPTLLFCSPLIQRHFVRLYGPPAHGEVLLNPAFDPKLTTPMSREAARRAIGLPQRSFVVGFLGGVDERKGYRELISSFKKLPTETLLVMAGPSSDGFASQALGRQLKSMGMLRDMAAFWAAVDVLVVPSRFDPFGMVVTEAATAGVPVVVTPEIGAADLVRAHHAGEVVERADLAAGILRVRDNVGAYQAGLRSLVASVSAESQSEALLNAWSGALRRNRGPTQRRMSNWG
jgi:glycosyltransferase involved in cell wall biosynthesis